MNIKAITTWYLTIFLGLLMCSFTSVNHRNKVYMLDFYTQYNQFYIRDKASPSNTGSNRFWTTDAHNDRLAIEDGILGVGTPCYGHVKGEVNFLTTVPKNIAYNRYDHIVEGSIVLKTGILQIVDYPNSKVELELKVAPGSYRVRISCSNLASTISDEYEGNDYYKIEIWPDNIKQRKVLKRYINQSDLLLNQD